jgi:hypothetical protein
MIVGPSASTWIAEQFREIHNPTPELIRRWHPIISHQSFNGSHVTGSVHASDFQYAVPLHVEGKEMLGGHVAQEDNLVRQRRLQRHASDNLKN